METILPKPPYSYNLRARPHFIIWSNTKLSDRKLHTIARRFIQKQKERLFNAWKLLPKNASWRGDVSAKQRELLRASPLSNPCILELAEAESLLKEILRPRA
jgi:hypothetical protein